MVFGDLDSRDEEDDDNAAGGTDLRPFRIVVPINRGSATPALPRAARAPGVAARLAVSRVLDVWRLFSAAVSATCFRILPLGLFLPAKTRPTSGMAASNILFPTCLATGRIYLRTIGMGTLAIRIANASKPPAPAPISRAGPKNAAFS